MFVYYETYDGSGWYAIKLFTSRLEAEKYHKRKGDAYGHTDEILVDDEVEAAKSSTIENVKCPDCNGDMISRKSQYGTFWGCKKYPKCKGLETQKDYLEKKLAKHEIRAEKKKKQGKIPIIGLIRLRRFR